MMKLKISGKLLVFAVMMLCFACESGSENAPVDEMPKETLVDITEATGIDFVHDAGVDSSYYFPEIMGAGSVFFDYDNDGKQDIYFVNGGDHTGKVPPENRAVNRLYRQGADGRFTDVTANSGLTDNGYGMGAAAGDIDNDGDLDLYVSNVNRDALYRNNGDGTFSDISESAGISNEGWGVSIAFLDYDLDNFLDIYVTNYVELDTTVKCTYRNGRPMYCGPANYSGAVDVLYRNNGDGTFSDVTEKAGIATAAKKGLGVVPADYNQDGYPDLYVANDQQVNLCWINQKDGTFKESALLMGIAVNYLGKREAGMGIALGDLNNDLLLDLYVTHVENESNTFYLNKGEVGFTDQSRDAGFEQNSLLPYTGFGVGFLDLDRDGYLDILVANGRINRGNSPRLPGDKYWLPYGEQNLVLAGNNGRRFQDVSGQYPAFFEPKELSRGLALADIDNDGDLDVLINNIGAAPRLYRNDVPAKGNWVSFTVYDPELKRVAVGATVKILGENFQSLYPVNPYYSYITSNDFRVFAGLGDCNALTEIEVTWPGGEKEIFPGSAVNRHIQLNRGDGKRQE